MGRGMVRSVEALLTLVEVYVWQKEKLRTQAGKSAPHIN